MSLSQEFNYYYTESALTGGTTSEPVEKNIAPKNTGSMSKIGQVCFISEKLGGSGSLRAENQDALVFGTITVEGISAFVIVVCDGHGEQGQYYADQVSSLVWDRVKDRLIEVIGDPIFTLHTIFIATNLDCQYFGLGGTTCTVTIIMDERIICANSGNCEAIAVINCSPENIEVKVNDEPFSFPSPEGSPTITHIRLTTEHTGYNPKEAMRVRAAGATVDYKCLTRDPSMTRSPMYAYGGAFIPGQDISGTYKINASGRLAHNIRDVYSGEYRTVTRSFGDWGLNFIIAQPDITDVTFPAGTHVRLVTGSDGYFNCISESKQFVVAAYDPIDEVVSTGLSEAYNLFPGSIFGTTNADNLTVLVYDSESVA